MAETPWSRRDEQGQRRATPRWYAAELQRRFDIRLDVCAEPHTAVVPRHYDIEANGLARSWDTDGGWYYCNPPWGHVDPWLHMAHYWRGRGVSGLLQLKCDPGARWFRKHKHEAHHIRLITPRMAYLDADTMQIGKGDRSPSHNSCLWVFDGTFAHSDNTRGGPLVMRYWHLPRPRGAN
jgi:hypothetical protein